MRDDQDFQSPPAELDDTPELGITAQQAKDNIGAPVAYYADGRAGYVEHGVIASVPGRPTAVLTDAFVKFDGGPAAKLTPLDRLVLIGPRERASELGRAMAAAQPGSLGGDGPYEWTTPEDVTEPAQAPYEGLTPPAAEDEPDSPDESLLWLVANVLGDYAGESTTAAAKGVLGALAKADAGWVIRELYGPGWTQPPALPPAMPMPAYHQVDPFGPPPWAQVTDAPPVSEQAALVPEPHEYRQGDRVIYQQTPAGPPLFGLVKSRASGSRTPAGLAEYDIRVPYQGTNVRAMADQLRPYPYGAAKPENTGEVGS